MTHKTLENTVFSTSIIIEALIALSLRLPGESFGGAIGRPGTFCEPAVSQIE